MISSRSVNLKWQPRGGDAAEVTKYIVEYMEIDRPWHQIELNPPQYTVLVEPLKPATKYTFRVFAEGPAGQSASSQEIVIKTEPQRPAGPPLNLNARPVSSTEILVTWLPPLSELRHGEIQGYNVGYKSSTSSSSTYNFTSVSGDGESGTGELVLSGLAKYTRYTLVAQAFNQVGPGPLSEPATAQTLEDGLFNCHFYCQFVFFIEITSSIIVPSRAPEDVRCAALTSQSLQISWQPPPDHYSNGLLQGYKLNFELVIDSMMGSGGEIETRKTTALTTVLSGLKRYSNYSVQVLAFTRMGDGVMSNPTFCRTEEDGRLQIYNLVIEFVFQHFCLFPIYCSSRDPS